MTQKQLSEYMEQLKGGGMNYGLGVMGELCRRLGNPQDGLKFVHIAGTNGKGSVLCFIANILMAAGYRVGCFFSPAIKTPREVIRIGRRMIAQADYCHYISLIKKVADEMVAEGQAQPSAFELECALAFLYFIEKKVDIVVLEAGMGGTLDATNVIKAPVVAVITSVGHDHGAYLGGNLAEIAAHKAGIIKAGSFVVSAAQQEAATSVIAEKCEALGCPLRFAPVADKKGGIKRQKPGKPDYHRLIFSQHFSYDGLDNLSIHMAGSHQLENAVLAVEAVRALGGCEFTIREGHIRQGLSAARWPGRFELLRAKPPVIVDGAHNTDAALRLFETLKMYFTKRRIIYIMGVFADKDYAGMIAAGCVLAEHVITVTLPDGRALPAYELAQCAQAYHHQVTAADSIHEACELALLLAGKDGVVLAFGSLTLVDGVRKSVAVLEVGADAYIGP